MYLNSTISSEKKSLRSKSSGKSDDFWKLPELSELINSTAFLLSHEKICNGEIA